VPQAPGKDCETSQQARFSQLPTYKRHLDENAGHSEPHGTQTTPGGRHLSAKILNPMSRPSICPKTNKYPPASNNLGASRYLTIFTNVRPACFTGKKILKSFRRPGCLAMP